MQQQQLDQLDRATATHLQQCYCFYCGVAGHTTSCRGCPQLVGRRLLYRAMPRADVDQLRRGNAYHKLQDDQALDLTAYQHVSFGNVQVRSRYFSASVELDPAIFWTTCIVRNGRTVPSRGHNWDQMGIALLDRAHVTVQYDVSNAYQCCIHKLNTERMAIAADGRCYTDPRVWRLATSNGEVILSQIEPASLLAYRTVEELCLWGLDAASRNQRKQQMDRWCLYDMWASRSRHGFIVSCPHWLPR